MRVSVKNRNNLVYIGLSGAIDEGARPALDTALDALRRSPATINCRRIDRMNSLGIKLWVGFAKEIGSSPPLALEECPMVMLAYAQLVPNFFRPFRITSIVISLGCVDCGKEQKLTVTAQELRTMAEFPAGECPACGRESISEMTLDECKEAIGNAMDQN